MKNIHKKEIGLIFTGVMFLTVGILSVFGYTDWYSWLIGVGVALLVTGICKLRYLKHGKGSIFVGILLLAMGLSYLLNISSIIFIGLGLAFLFSALILLMEKKEEKKESMEKEPQELCEFNIDKEEIKRILKELAKEGKLEL